MTETSKIPPTRAAPAESKIGYKKPPREHQYKKGQSGNPSGRPRKVAVPAASSECSNDDIVLKEAKTLITLSENGAPTTIPAIQAVMRGSRNAAIKGDGVGGRRWLATVQEAEQRKKQNNLYNVTNLLEYKRAWTAEIKRCREAADLTPNPIPHPDDIQVDLRSGEICLNGPMDDAEALKWSKADEERKALKADIQAHKDQIANVESKCELQFLAEMLWDERDKLDELERIYPPLHQRRKLGFSLNKHRAECKPIKRLQKKTRKARKRAVAG